MAVGSSSFVLVASTPGDLFPLLKRAFEDDWVTSYQLGFGPPLIRASEKLALRLKDARSALQKLEAYLDCCFHDDAERVRLSNLHRKALVRRLGPMEAETLRASSADVFDLSLRLFTPMRAPPKIRGEMHAAGLDFTTISEDTAPDGQSGRFLLHLDDHRGERLLHVLGPQVPADALALEVRVPVTFRPLWLLWFSKWTQGSPFRFFDLVEPPSLAKVSRDGARE